MTPLYIPKCLDFDLPKDDNPNRIIIKNENQESQTIWFRGDVPVRQWNSLCIIRKFAKEFKIYQNDDLSNEKSDQIKVFFQNDN